MAKKFEVKTVEQDARALWGKKGIYQIIQDQAKDKPKFYFLQGPPYTNGKIHLGHAWNHALKDLVIRYKRMKGFNVWDRAGWDMHGLPTEWAVMKEHDLKDDQDVKKFGEDKFIEECRKFCIDNMHQMTETLKEFGMWMNFDDPYMTLSKEWINGVWWFIKKAHEQERLYEGLRTMTWDVPAATAVAKHELEYKEVEDTAIFVKFELKEKPGEYLVIWTTTPWTIPFNLAVMVNPELDYDKVKIRHNGEEEYWWVCKDLAEHFLGMIEQKIDIVETKKGVELEGVAYTHPFAKDMGYDHMAKELPKLHTVLLSKEYVDTGAGSGLVHCAPGCGPEDFEVGHRNGLPAHNTVNENGIFEQAGQFNGLVAKKDDETFIAKMKEHGCLIHTHSYVHDYPHDQRSKEPVIFRTTKQWFIKVEDIQQEVIKENNEILWQPKAAYNAFNSWLENLRDNSISKQRYWGTPLPIWRNTENPDDYLVIGSEQELEKLTGKMFEDLHGPALKGITITKDGKTYERVIDVIDVWVDAGIASYACLKFPQNEDEFNDQYPADFILEGKDQVRGWFNLLHIVSMVAFGKKAFKACYMHGFINDSQGRKMSKSLKNYITPDEITDKYGMDVARMYFVGCAQPGLDANYNPEDVEQRFRNLMVLWNTHNYLVDLMQNNNFSKGDIAAGLEHLSIEEKYILSKLSTMTSQVEKAMDEYQLNVIPALIENFWLDLSRTYIQLVRDKTQGSTEERLAVFATLATCLKDTLVMLSSLAPHLAEGMWQSFVDIFDRESVHLCQWPVANEDFVNEELEKGMRLAQDVITAGLAARERAKLGVRWPVASITLEVENKNDLKQVEDLIKTQLNVKQIQFDKVPVKLEAKPNYRVIGKIFGQQTADVLTMLKTRMDKAIPFLEKGDVEFTLEGFTFGPDMFDVTILPAEGTTSIMFDHGKLMIDTNLSDELKAEGYLRELTRRVQQLRKEAGLEKKDQIKLLLGGDVQDLDLDLLKEKVSATSISEGGENEFKVKERRFTLGLENS